MCKAKILGAHVTESKHRYWASLEVDQTVLRAAGVHDYEKALVVNVENGARFETYVRAAEPGSGRVVLAGGTALLGNEGDEIGFLVFALVPVENAATYRPKVVKLGADNAVEWARDGDPGEYGLNGRPAG